MDESRGGSRIVYPKLFPTLTEADLAGQFRLAPEERAWAGTAARRGPSMVVLLTQLKVFQSIGHFLPLAQIPATALYTLRSHFHWRRPRTFQSTRAQRIGKTVPFALTWVLRRGVQALEPSLRTPLPWRPRRGSIRRNW